MGKKALSSTPSDAPTSPTSPTTQLPRMEAPPPYDQVVSGRRSSSISMHSRDQMNPELDRTPNAGPTPSSAEATAPAARNSHDHKRRAHEDGGCMNFGQNVDGCMNIGGGWTAGKTSGCMNIGGGQMFRKTDGCMNYQSSDGCMNYKSSGGCLNYKVYDDWEGNEGCLNWRRGGGMLLRA